MKVKKKRKKGLRPKRKVVRPKRKVKSNFDGPQLEMAVVKEKSWTDRYFRFELFGKMYCAGQYLAGLGSHKKRIVIQQDPTRWYAFTKEDKKHLKSRGIKKKSWRKTDETVPQEVLNFFLRKRPTKSKSKGKDNRK